MKTLRDVRDWVFRMEDEPLELEKNCQKCIQARECLGNYLQTDNAQNDLIREAQDKIGKILYIEDNEKNIQGYWWDFRRELKRLIDILADLTGCTTI